MFVSGWVLTPKWLHSHKRKVSRCEAFVAQFGISLSLVDMKSLAFRGLGRSRNSSLKKGISSSAVIQRL